jgi:hypothetical protein
MWSNINFVVSCRTPEKKYSPMCDKMLGVSGIAAPSIQLSKATQQFLEELMMEGDLLEVTLDETVYLWKLLNASKNYGNELEVIRKMYNIPVSRAWILI